jgi:hypothetical protein
MKAIDTAILLALDPLFDDIKLSRTHPIALNNDVQFPPKLIDLLQTIFGTDKDNLEDFLSSKRFGHNNINFLLLSLMGAAVHTWCLEPLPQGDNFWDDNRWATEAANQLGYHLKYQMVRSFLELHKEPYIATRAAELARSFDQLLPFLLPVRAEIDHRDQIDVIISLSPVPAAEDMPKSQTGWHLSWMKRLIYVFQFALNWRTEIEKTGGAIYTFNFPLYRMAFKGYHKPTHSAGRRGSEDTVKGQVLVGLMSSVSRVRTDELEKKTPEKMEPYCGMLYRDKFFEKVPSGDVGKGSERSSVEQDSDE